MGVAVMEQHAAAHGGDGGDVDGNGRGKTIDGGNDGCPSNQLSWCHGHGVMVMVAFSVSNGEGGESEGGHDGVTKGGMAVRLVMRVVLMVILARLDRG